MTNLPLVQRVSNEPLIKGHLIVFSTIPMILVRLWGHMSKGGRRIDTQKETHTGSHPWNSAFISCRAVCLSHVAGSEVSRCESTMLKALPAPIV